MTAIEPPGKFRAIVIGGSAGGLQAVVTILSQLPSDYALPIFFVQHLRSSEDDNQFAEHLTSVLGRPVTVPDDKEQIEGGRLYVAPPDYHMLVEEDFSISLSVDERVNWSRPSIDVLFESAARAYGASLLAIILSGANADGSHGIKEVLAFGGSAVAQDPESAVHPIMPSAAITQAEIQTILDPVEIGKLLAQITTGNHAKEK